MASVEPAAGKARAAQSCAEITAAAHEAPGQSGPVVLHQQHDRALVDAVIPFAAPSVRLVRTAREKRIERRLEVIDALVTHVIVTDAAKVDPCMRQLMDEQRSGIDVRLTSCRKYANASRWTSSRSASSDCMSGGKGPGGQRAERA